MNTLHCPECSLIVEANAPGTHTWINAVPYNKLHLHGICTTTIMSCCGNGTSTNIRYNYSKNHWECKECGSVKSNDPNYLYHSALPDPNTNNKPAATSNRCECGSSKVGSDRHSGYCPLYRP